MRILMTSTKRSVPSFPLDTPIPVVSKRGKDYVVDQYGGYLELDKIAECEITFEVIYAT